MAVAAVEIWLLTCLEAEKIPVSDWTPLGLRVGLQQIYLEHSFVYDLIMLNCIKTGKRLNSSGASPSMPGCRR